MCLETGVRLQNRTHTHTLRVNNLSIEMVTCTLPYLHCHLRLLKSVAGADGRVRVRV